jgi:hypothetical protein
LDIVRSLDSFCIYHIPREKNKRANTLAQRASGYEVTIGVFIVKEKPASRGTCNAELVDEGLYLDIKEVGNGPMSHDPKHGASAIETPQEVHVGTGPTLLVAKDSQVSRGESVGKKYGTNDGNVKERTATDALPAHQGQEDKLTTGGRVTRPDWKESITEYIKNPGSTRDRKRRRQALKYTLMNDELYRRTIDGLLLKCMNEEQARIAMGEVHKGLCRTHQSAHKMKWLLKRARLYWLTMVEDCIRYQKGCDACQRFRNV